MENLRSWLLNRNCIAARPLQSSTFLRHCRIFRKNKDERHVEKFFGRIVDAIVTISYLFVMSCTFAPETTVDQAAALCGVSAKTVIRWMKSGLLRAVLVGGRYRTTEAWIAESFRTVAKNSPESPSKDRDHETDYAQSLRNIEARFKLKVSRPGVRS